MMMGLGHRVAVVPPAQGCLPPHLVTDTFWKLILPDSRWGGGAVRQGKVGCWPSIFCCELSWALHSGVC